jgi:DNA polymerase-3 subunit epsilon
MHKTLWQRLQHGRAQRKLRDPDYAFILDAAPENEWVSIDCETSSLDPRQADILSIAAVPVHGNRILTSEVLKLELRPTRPITAQSIPIHQLRQQDLNEGLSAQEAVSQFVRFIGARPLIGYYLEFDLAVLNRQIKPWLGIPLPNAAIDVSGLYYDRKITAYRPEVDLSLDTILNDLDLPLLPRHDPINDALLAAMIFLKLTHHGPL